MIGQTISHYNILEKLGEGGMGVVYKAEDTKLKRTVALKFLPPGLTRDPEAKERFSTEARAAAALEHQHICNIYEIAEAEDRVFIVMSYFEGQTLREKIDAGPLTIDEALKIARQAAKGLQAAHEKGILHRDIKSDNIMVTVKGRTKILDFGLAKLKGQTQITKEGSTLGTAAYMSPEQARGAEVDHRTDIWSLGVVLYEMITGQLPFKGDYEQAVIYSIMNEAPEPLTSLRTGVPMELERIVNKALAKDPAERYQHADDLMVDLKKLQKNSEPGMSASGKTVRVEPSKQPMTKWVIGAVAMILVLLLGFWFLSNKQPPKPPAVESGEKPKTAQRKKIVILPFENLGSPEDKFFADGMTEEITSRLAVVSGLGVISRTSAVQYDRKGKTLKQMGEDLGVDYVLEGTVRWDRAKRQAGHRPGLQVRVTPQLIRVSDDTHLWSERYDRDIEDIFEVQSEIAEHVIHHLGVTLLEPEQRTLKARPTKNIDAYNAYIRGIEFWRHAIIEKEPMQLSIQMLKRAVELDPGFTLAYVKLTMVHSLFYHMGYDRTKERISKAKAALDRARQLQPELPEVFMALGVYHYWCHREYQQALDAFSVARKGLPNEPLILSYVAYIQRRQGRFREAIDNLKTAVELDPQNSRFHFELGNTYLFLKKYSQAESSFDRAISLSPDQVAPYGLKAANYRAWKGDLGKARTTLERMPQKNDDDSIYFWYLQELYEKNYPAALTRISLLSVGEKFQMTGYIYQLMNQPESARKFYEEARVYLEKKMEIQPDDPDIRSSLGIVYAYLGRKEEAIREVRLASALLPVSKDAFEGPVYIERLAYVYILVGEYDLAGEKLDYVLSIPSDLSVPLLKLDPKWDPLRKHPKFQQLLKKYAPDKEENKDYK